MSSIFSQLYSTDLMLLKNANFMLTIGHYCKHLLTPDIQYVMVVNLSDILWTLMIKMLRSRNLFKWLAFTIYHHRRRNCKQIVTIRSSFSEWSNLTERLWFRSLVQFLGVGKIIISFFICIVTLPIMSIVLYDKPHCKEDWGRCQETYYNNY